jgi:nucleoside-diphosphate-sugar epimerase
VASSLYGARVLVTGASGFLGGRLVERLVAEYGAQVRVLVRRAMSAAPVARFPVEVVVGDVADPHALAISAEGCAVVFHCAKAKGPDPVLRRAVDVDGAGHVVEAARRAGARVVHVSTMAVYQRPSDGLFDETTPDVAKGDLYSDTKLEGEQVALARGAQYGVPVVVVQPAIIYGPNAPCAFEMLSELRTTRVILPNGGVGICNLVYVDDAVTALVLAATSDRAAGERFLISGPEYPTWAQFVASFESMLGVHRTVSLSEHDALRLWGRSRRSRWLVPEALRAIKTDPRLRERLLGTREAIAARWIATRVLPRSLLGGLRTASRVGDQSGSHDELPIEPVRPWVVRNMTRKARVSIEKAHRILGYVPVFTLDRGMDLTEQWARWAGLIPPPDYRPRSNRDAR